MRLFIKPYVCKPWNITAKMDNSYRNNLIKIYGNLWLKVNIGNKKKKE